MIRAAALAAGLALVVATACSDEPEPDPIAFCATLAEVSAADAAVTALDLDDQTVVEAATAALDRLRRLAPPEIDDDVDRVASTYSQVIEALAGTGPRARPDVLREYQAELDAVIEAASRLEGYAVSNCGLDLRPAPTEPEGATADPAGAG